MGSDETRLMKALLENARSKHKEVHAPAADVCGLLLAKPQLLPLSSAFEEALNEQISIQLRSGEYDVAVIVLLHVGTYHGRFLDKYFVRLFDLLRKLIGQFRAAILQMILYRALEIPDLWKQLQPLLGSDSRVGLLNQRDDTCQLVSTVL